MKSFQLSRYLKKWLPIIIVFFVAMTGLSYVGLASIQKHTASAVIQYTNSGAVEGYAPDGSKINVSEINSSANMAKVMNNLELEGDYNLDTLCASITVEAVEEEQSEAIQEAYNEEGMEYTQVPTSYIIRCTLGSPADEDLVRDILNETLDVYFAEYSNKHINEEQIDNNTKDLTDMSYDYMEMVENIESNLENTISELYLRYQKDSSFRSTQTGYSFYDLCDRFMILNQVNISRLYSQILGNQITKDRELLINKYNKRIADYQLIGEKAQEDINEIVQVIETYVQKMRESENTDIDYNYILNEVYDNWIGNGEGGGTMVDRSVEYDTLLGNWVTYKDQWDHATVDVAYCQYIIGIYEGQTVYPVTERVTAEEIEQEIKEVTDQMNSLYQLVDITNQEYNEYLGAKNIRILSTVSVENLFNLKLFTGMIAVFFLIIGCGGAVLLGRAGDIVEYLFLLDHQTGCQNRIACDHYIQRREKQAMASAFCCMNIQIQNQRDMNKLLGREEADKVLKEFGGLLLEAFSSRDKSFVGYNGSGQFWVFYEMVQGEEKITQEIERLVSIIGSNLEQYPVAYYLGGVNAGEEKTYQIRALIPKAVARRELYKTNALKERTEGNEN